MRCTCKPWWKFWATIPDKARLYKFSCDISDNEWPLIGSRYVVARTETEAIEALGQKYFSMIPLRELILVIPKDHSNEV